MTEIYLDEDIKRNMVCAELERGAELIKSGWFMSPDNLRWSTPKLPYSSIDLTFDVATAIQNTWNKQYTVVEVDTSTAWCWECWIALTAAIGFFVLSGLGIGYLVWS